MKDPRASLKGPRVKPEGRHTFTHRKAGGAPRGVAVALQGHWCRRCLHQIQMAVPLQDRYNAEWAEGKSLGAERFAALGNRAFNWVTPYRSERSSERIHVIKEL